MLPLFILKQHNKQVKTIIRHSKQIESKRPFAFTPQTTGKLKILLTLHKLLFCANTFEDVGFVPTMHTTLAHAKKKIPKKKKQKKATIFFFLIFFFILFYFFFFFH